MKLRNAYIFGFCVHLAVGASLPAAAEVPENLCTAEWAFASEKWGADGSIEGGLRIRLAPGWHTYAPDPGDVGAPPRITLKTPDGIPVSEPRFPPHKKFADPAGVSYGYEKEFLVRYTFTRRQTSSKPPPLEIDIELLLCREICVPFFNTIKVPWPTEKTGEEAGNPSDRWRDLLRKGGWDSPPSGHKAGIYERSP